MPTSYVVSKIKQIKIEKIILSTEDISHTDAINIVKVGGKKIALTVKRSKETPSKLYILLLNCWVNVNIISYTVGGTKTISFIQEIHLRLC